MLRSLWQENNKDSSVLRWFKNSEQNADKGYADDSFLLLFFIYSYILLLSSKKRQFTVLINLQTACVSKQIHLKVGWCKGQNIFFFK